MNRVSAALGQSEWQAGYSILTMACIKLAEAIVGLGEDATARILTRL